MTGEAVYDISKVPEYNTTNTCETCLCLTCKCGKMFPGTCKHGINCEFCKGNQPMTNCPDFKTGFGG